MTDEHIFDELEIVTTALVARGFTDTQISDAMLSFAMGLSVKARGCTDVARHLQMTVWQLTAEEQRNAQAPRH